MEKLFYFLDESGNSGSRFWDTQQPTYIEGGWVVERSDVDRIAKIIKNLESTYATNIKEIKGKKLIKHSRGQKLILDIMHQVGQNGGIPVLHIFEKKYMVCGKIVETFLDPFYNSKVPQSEQWELEKRQDIAQFFYDTNSPLLREFAEAYRTKNNIAIKQNAQQWVTYLQSNGHTELSDQIRNIIPTIENDIVTEFSFSDNIEYKGIDSINIPVWVRIFQHIEQKTPAPCTIIHDKIDTFENAYLYVFKKMKNASSGIIQFRDRQLVYPIQAIEDLTFHDSVEDPIIRAADVVVGSSAHYIEKVMSDDMIPNLVHQIGFRTLGIFLMDIIAYTYPKIGPSLQLGSITGSKGWIKRLIDALVLSAEKYRGRLLKNVDK